MFADDILGDFEKRYFGAGHKRTNYKLKGDISVSGRVIKKNLLHMRSDNWRIFEMAGSSADGNVRFQGKIAHILPDEKKEIRYA